MRDLVSGLFGASHLNSHAKGLLLRYLTYSSLVRAVTSLSSTFLVLYVIDAVGFALTGVLIAIQMSVQAFFDYPTGILSDRLGQKKVLLMAYLSFGVSFFIFSTSDSYLFLVFAYIFYAFAIAQESGTLLSWFDNNYKFIAAEDSDRSAYKIIIGKARTIIDFFGGFMLLVGGWLATNYSRVLVLEIQATTMIIVLLATHFLINDFEGYFRKSFDSSYLSLLKTGITSIFQSKVLTLLVLGNMFFQIGLGIFGNLVIFPVYFGYTGSDFGASIFRFTLFIAGSVGLWLMADKIGKLSSKKWIPRINLIHTLLFFSGIFVLFSYYPIGNTFNLQAVLLAGSIIFVTHILRLAFNIHVQRLYLDLIPDERRNGFYSFAPSLVLLVQAPFILYSGSTIAEEGFVSLTFVIGTFLFIGSLIFMLAARFLPEDM